MYLSRLILNPRSRQVQRELIDPYQMHRTVLSGFPDQLPADERVLFRLEQEPHRGFVAILVQSQHKPDWSSLTTKGKDYLLPLDDLPEDWDNPALKVVEIQLQPNQLLAFRLLANPTMKKVISGKKNGQRVGIYDENAQIEWLQRKLAQAGARLISARATQPDRLTGSLYRNEQKHTITFCAVQFEGILQVQDPEQLQATIKDGVGSAKGFGFGLLSLAPAPSS